MPARSRPRVIVCTGLVLTLGGLGCGEGPTTGPDSPGVRAARGGNGNGGGGGSDPTVERTDPSSTPQGVTLDLRVFGTNYEPGSSVAILLDLKSTPKVKTNSTTYISDTELSANITVAEDAEIDLYDVQVTTLRGKKGVGIELLEITAPFVELATQPTDPTLTGLYEDGHGFYFGGFNMTNGGQGNGNYHSIPDCAEGRAMKLVPPAAWPDVGAISECDWPRGSKKTDDGQRVRFQIPGLHSADCADGARCPIGGSPEGTNFGPSLYYFFYVDGDRDGWYGERGDPLYNAVWTDATFAVANRAGDGTPCRFDVSGRTADLWEGAEQVAIGTGLDLHAVVTRIDGPCAP